MIIIGQANTDGTALAMPCGDCSTNPVSCCFYPYSLPGIDPEWPASDAPATVTAGLIVLTKYTGFHYVDYSDDTGEYQLYIDEEQGSWHITGPTVDVPIPLLAYNFCLFGTFLPPPTFSGTIVYDNFPNTLSLNGFYTLNRTVATDQSMGIEGSCVWSGSGYTLQYNYASGPNQYLYTLTDTGGFTYALNGDQISPIGTGTGIYGPYEITS